jgi:hypothetical protein
MIDEAKVAKVWFWTGAATAMVIIAMFGLCIWLLAPREARAHVSTPNTFKTWVSNETLQVGDLNDNFAHLHSTLTGNIKDSNISTTAAIQHSKLAQPGLLPRAVVMIGSVASPCNGSAATACVLSGAVNVTGAVGTGSNGSYHVTLNYSPSSLSKPVLATPQAGDAYCTAEYINTFAPHMLVRCYDNTGTLKNVVVSLVAY